MDTDFRDTLKKLCVILEVDYFSIDSDDIDSCIRVLENLVDSEEEIPVI